MADVLEAALDRRAGRRGDPLEAALDRAQTSSFAVVEEEAPAAESSFLGAFKQLPGQLARALPTGLRPGPDVRLIQEHALDIDRAERGDQDAADRLGARGLIASSVASVLPGGPALRGLTGRALASALARRAALGAGAGAAGGALEAGAAGQPVGRGALTGAAVGAALGPLAGLGGRAVERVSEAVEAAAPRLETPVGRVLTALRAAPRVIGRQAALRRKELGRRVGQARKVGGETAGVEGFRAELRQLGGELPRIDFEPIRDAIDPTDVTAIFEQIKLNPRLGYFETVHAREGFDRLLSGGLPAKHQIVALREALGDDFTKALLDKRSTLARAAELGIRVANLPREILSSYDISAPLRQGAFLIGRPKQFVPAFRNMLRYFVSERNFKAGMDEIAARPTAKLMRQSGLALTESGALLNRAEEVYASGLAGRIPIFGRGIRASERAYIGFLNKLRADVFDDLIAKGQSLGHEPQDLAREVATFVNMATGRGKLPGQLEGAATTLATVFFSPRLMASRFQLLNPAYYLQALNPRAAAETRLVRREAIKSLLTAGSAATTVLTLAKLAGAEVTTDPTDVNFGKLKVGNTRFDMLAGFGQYIRAGARLATQDGKIATLGRFFRSKEAPVLGMIHNILAGNSPDGSEVTIPAQAKRLLVPLIAQDIQDAIQEWGPVGAAAGLPAAVGISVQTYEE